MSIVPAAPYDAYYAWGRLQASLQLRHRMASRHDALPPIASVATGVTALPYGNGRSYGDSCLNPGGMALETAALDHFIALDETTGIMRCEAGVLFDDLLRLIVPRGWILPVSPGTRFVTVGGAIANDVHGKNHHRAGTFGRHLRTFELLRSDGSRPTCSATENAALYRATIGGLGLTGLITWAEFTLKRVAGPWLDCETLRFHHVGEFFDLAAASDRDYEYTVAWVDCLSRGDALGRGLFMRANHAPAYASARRYHARRHSLPFTPPVSMVNRWSLGAFNALYYHRPVASRTLQHYEPFFYPLDGIRNWNRLYGKRGFYQYQCVVPMAASRVAVEALLKTVSASGLGSFLAVLKICGDQAPAGLISFPLHGATLALDFPNHGETGERLFRELDAIVGAHGGRLYPAKDARMPAALFQAGYPHWQELRVHADPQFSSAFWRRVTEPIS